MKNKKAMMKKLDELVKEIVFERDNYCVTCPLWMEIKKDSANPHNPSNVMQPGHFITRNSKSVRWNLKNVYKQCRTCNYIHEMHPEVLGQYVLNKIGKKEYEDLVFLGNQPMPSINIIKLQEMYDKLIEIREAGEV